MRGSQHRRQRSSVTAIESRPLQPSFSVRKQRRHDDSDIEGHSGSGSGSGGSGGQLSDGESKKPAKAGSGDDEVSDLTTDEELELDEMLSDDDIHDDDEELGLTSRDRARRRKRRRRRTRIDGRIAGDGALAKEKKIADATLMRKLVINTTLILLWYFFSLSISIVSFIRAIRHILANGFQYNKWMFSSDHLDFHFPLFTTSLHMVVQFSFAAMILYLIPSLRPTNARHEDGDQTPTDPSKPVLSKLFYVTRLVPCGTATSLDIGLGNMSLKFISLTFLTMCKSSALAFVLLFAFLFKLETPSLKLILIIGTMTIGVVMMVFGEAAFNAVGFMLVIASAFFSGFRWALTQILLLRHPATSNPFATLFLLAPIMFTTLMVIAIPIEGPLEIAAGLRTLTEARGTFSGILLLLFPGILAFCMTSSEFALLQRTNVVTLSICGIFKEVVTITAAGIVFHDPLTPINVSGLVVTILSIAAYNYLKITKMRREAAREAADAIHPTSRTTKIHDAGDGNDDGAHESLLQGSSSRDVRRSSRLSVSSRRSKQSLEGKRTGNGLTINTTDTSRSTVGGAPVPDSASAAEFSAGSRSVGLGGGSGNGGNGHAGKAMASALGTRDYATPLLSPAKRPQDFE